MISATEVIDQLRRLGFRVNGDTWDWCVSDCDDRIIDIGDGQESATCDAAELASLLLEIEGGDVTAAVWDAIQESSCDV